MSFITCNCCPCQWPENCVSELAKVFKDISKCCWGGSQVQTTAASPKQKPVEVQTHSNTNEVQAPSNSDGLGGWKPTTIMGGHIPNNNGALLFVARELQIEHHDDPECWTWKKLPEEPRFKEVAELRQVWWLDIKAKIKFIELSPETNYAAYLIFKIASSSKGLNTSQEALVSVGPLQQIKAVCVNPRVVMSHRPIGVPMERSDGWMEIELGQFKCDDGAGDKLVVVGLKEIDKWNEKNGLIVAGVEIRPI